MKTNLCWLNPKMKAGETVSFLFSLGSRLRLRLDGRRRRRRLSEINRLVGGRDGNRKDKKTGGRGGFWRDKKVQSSFFVLRGEGKACEGDLRVIKGISKFKHMREKAPL